MTFKFLSIEDFPAVRTNCLGFALGLTDWYSNLDLALDYLKPIADAFVEKVKELGFEVVPRQIASVEEATEDEYIFKIYDFSDIYSQFEGRFVKSNFHVCRRDPDGCWFHKPGWKDLPCEITDWDSLEEEFGSNYVLFAVKRESAV